MQYQLIHEEFEYKNLKIENSRNRSQEVSFFLPINMDTLFFSDTIAMTNSEDIVIRHWNQHSYFNVPIDIGYRYYIGKANLFGSLGASFAFPNKHRGQLNQLFGEGTNTNVANPTINIKNRLGYQLGIGIEFPFTEDSQLFVKSSYRRSPVLSGESKEQYYQSISFGAGIKIGISSW